MKKILPFLLILTLSSCDMISAIKNVAVEGWYKIVGESIVGNWTTTINLKGGNVVDVYYEFNFDGTGKMVGKSGINKEERSFTWIREGDIIYLHSYGESKVGEVEIISINRKKMILQFKGEKEKLFLNRID